MTGSLSIEEAVALLKKKIHGEAFRAQLLINQLLTHRLLDYHTVGLFHCTVKLIDQETAGLKAQNIHDKVKYPMKEIPK